MVRERRRDMEKAREGKIRKRNKKLSERHSFFTSIQFNIERFQSHKTC